jgi:hypothetical protein
VAPAQAGVPMNTPADLVTPWPYSRNVYAI